MSFIKEEHSQRGQHVAGADAVDADVGVSPLNSHRRRQMPHSSLRSVVRSLGLRDVDNGAGHRADHHDAAGRLTFHQVLGHASREEVGAVDVDAPELLDAIERILNRVEVLGEASRGHQVVDLAVLANDLGKDIRDRVGGGNIGVVGGDLGDTNQVSRSYKNSNLKQTYLSAPGFSFLKASIKLEAWCSASSSVTC